MFRMVRGRAVAIGLALVVLGVTLGTHQAHGQARRELRVGLPRVASGIDPATTTDAGALLIARQVFDTLVSYREFSTDVEPALATRWIVSRDGLAWRFSLRDGVKFHDGTPLTAQDVAASFHRLLHPDDAQAPTNPVWPTLLRGAPGVVKDVRAVDDHTIEMLLVQPYAPLLSVLAHPLFGITKRAASADPGAGVIGTGPYHVVDASPGRLAIEAVPSHWAGTPRSPRIVFLDVASDDQADAQFSAGALDIWFPAQPPRRADWTLSVPGLTVGYLAFQTEREPFARKAIRQAVTAAIDPAVIGVSVGRTGVPLQSFLPVGVWARREGAPLFTLNRDAVKKHLAEGHWPRGFTPTLLVAEEPPSTTLGQLAEALQLMLGAADMPLQLKTETPENARAALQAGNYDLVLTEATVGAGDPHLLLFPLSTSEGATKGPRALNYSFYRDSRLDDVLIRASQLSFRPERQRLYQRAQSLLAADVPWIPLYARLVWAVARPEIRGLRLHPTGFHRLATVGLDAAAVP